MAHMLSRQQLEEKRQGKTQSKGGGGAISDDGNIGKSPSHTQPPAAPSAPHRATQHATWLPPGACPIASPQLLAQLSEAVAKLEHLLKVHHYTQLYLPRAEMLVEVSAEIDATRAEISRIQQELPRS